MKTETLKENMIYLGYVDFNISAGNNNYFNLLTRESIKMINKFYHLDFVYFNYQKFSE